MKEWKSKVRRISRRSLARGSVGSVVEFTDAENRVRDLIEDYRQYETTTVPNDDDDLDG